MVRDRGTEILPAEWHRPEIGPCFSADAKLPFSGLPAWRSNGGPVRGHPARAFPLSLEVTGRSGLRRAHFLGIFAMYAHASQEAPGTMGASLHFGSESEILHRVDLVNGRNYHDAGLLTRSPGTVGDGTSCETVGRMEIDGEMQRIDLLSVDIPEGIPVDWIRFKDLGTPASFVIFDVMLECTPVHACPFHRDSGGVALADVSPALRLGDRVKFSKALRQLSQTLSTADDLDDAKGQALTFAAVVAATALEMGGGREMHRWMLMMSRQVDATDSNRELAELVVAKVEAVADNLIPTADGPSAYLMDKALSYVDRNYARELSDIDIAGLVGLSTSHFRFLFRQSTGQPFHRYLVNLRLEKAKQLLNEGGLTVSDAAKAVGFSGLAHFSRAFHSRFKMSPTSAKRQGA